MIKETLEWGIICQQMEMADSELTERVFQIIDKINEDSKSSRLLYFSKEERCGDVLISFLKELARKGILSQVDKIFRSGGKIHL